MSHKISFFSEGVSFTLKQKNDIRDWIKKTILTEGKKPGYLSFIFCDDEYLLQINQQYLNHDTFTDIITFDNSEEEELIEGDIFISLDRIKENAVNFDTSEKDELHRVIIHGVLHLLGYKDKTKAAKEQMSSKEDHYLNIRSF